jgi:hypothetical protein
MRRFAFVLCVTAGALIGAPGCSSAPPTAPTTTSPAATPVASPTPSPPVFPPAPDGARIFLDATGTPRPSRFLLFEDGTFALQYAGGGEYRGMYHTNAGTITFDWEDSNRAGPWGATGQLNGDTLTVRFNLVMGLADFEDGVYTLTTRASG